MSTLNLALSRAAFPEGQVDQMTASGPTAGDGRYTEDGLRHFAASETAALLQAERRRSDEIWLKALQAVKESLDRLETACDIAATTEPTNTTAAVSGVVERFVAAAAREADEAARSARAECELELAALRAAHQLSESNLRDERLKLHAALDAASRERAARAQSDAELADLKGSLAVCKSELGIAREELESAWAATASAERQLTRERTDRDNLMGVLRSVRRTVEDATTAAGSDPHTVAAELLTPEAPPPDEAQSTQQAVDQSAREVGQAPSGTLPHAQRNLVLVSGPQDHPNRGDADLLGYVRELLEGVETAYEADVARACPPADVLRRLADNLRIARERCFEDAAPRGDDAMALFEREVRVLLNASTATSFARHLGIAIHDLYRGATPASWTHARLAV